MSYRNPQQVVDTQSAQHIANLQNVISGTIQKVGASYKADEDKRVAEEKAKAKERAKRIDGYIKTEQRVWTSTEKTTQNNKSLTYEGLDTRIDEYSDISDKIDSGLLYGKELADARAYQRDILSLPGRIKNVTELYTEGVVGYDKAIRNQGGQGGVDMYSDSAVENLAVWQDKAPGTRKIFLNKNEKSGRLEVNLSITPEGGKERIYTESQLQQMSKNGGPMPLIPDETKDFEEAKAQYFYKIDNTTNKPVHRDGILGEEESREIKNDKGVVTAIQYYRPVNKEKAKLASRAMAKLNVESMEPFNGAMFANNVLGFGGTKDQVTEKNYEEKWPEITDAYNDYLVNNYIDELGGREEKVDTKETDAAYSFDEAKNLANELNGDDRLFFDIKSIRDLASDYGLTADAEASVAGGPIERIVIGEYRGKKLAVDRNDTEQDIINKIIRVKSPKLKDEQYSKIVSKLTGLKPGEGVLKDPIGRSGVISDDNVWTPK